jgi:acetyl-CoA carboxylase beta subunit
MDAAHTLIRAKDQRAKEAVSLALASVDGTQFKLLQMEAGFLAGRLGLGGEALSRANKILDSLDHELGSPEGFRARWTKE